MRHGQQEGMGHEGRETQVMGGDGERGTQAWDHGTERRETLETLTMGMESGAGT